MKKITAAVLLAGTLMAGMQVQAEVRIGSLKGPTSMGLVSMMEEAENGAFEEDYQFEMVTAADELLGKVISKEVDIALIPANTAAVLYNKTEGGIQVIDVNTLGVLYIVESGETIGKMSDLSGKTICLTGKGTTPDLVLRNLLKANGIEEDTVTLEYKSEAAEVVSFLEEDPQAIGLLPQPFVTAACMQNENLHTALDLTAEWDAVQKEGRLVTGVTVADADFVKEHPEAVREFLQAHALSSAYTNEHPEEASVRIEALGIVAKAALAEKAIPFCSIVCLEGTEMKQALEGYLGILYEMDPASVGGSLPEEDFYYISGEE